MLLDTHALIWMSSGTSVAGPRSRSEVSTSWSSFAADNFSARASISPASAFSAVACSALASEPASAASGAKVNPSRRPITWPSTITSPVLPISVFNIVFSRSRRINTLVRRSTKRSVSRSCSASDNLFSTSRVMPCQCSGSASQSGRLAAKVQVRIWAIRPDSVSISPSVRSACSTWAANQASGIHPFFIKNANTVVTSSACAAGAILR